MNFTGKRERVTYQWRGEPVTEELQVVSDETGRKKLMRINIRRDDDNTFLYRDNGFELQFDAELVWQRVSEERWDVRLGTALNELPGVVRATLDGAKVNDIMQSLKAALLVFIPSADGPVKKIHFNMRGWDRWTSLWKTIDGDDL